jgi:hypothetical protein
MEPEVILAIKEVALDFIKIVGSATVAALAAYKTASYQYKQKMAEIEKADQFKAAEMVFEIQKKSFEDVANSYNSITESIFTLTGTIIGGGELDELTSNFAKIMKVYIHRLPFSFRKMHREFSKYKEEYSAEYAELRKAEGIFEGLGKIETKNIIDYAVKLEFIYSTLSHCSQIIISEKMNDTLSKYSANK